MARHKTPNAMDKYKVGNDYGTLETENAFIFNLAPPLAGFIFEKDPLAIYPLAVVLIVISIFISRVFGPRKNAVVSS